MGVENYHVIELVGEGSFGKVYKGRCKLTGQTVAMKFIMKHGKSDKDIHNLRQKIEILRKLKHENIIEMLDSFESPQEFCVVAEFARGELFEILEDDKNLPEEQVQAIAKQLDLSVQPGNYVYSSVKAVPSICESGVPSGSTIQESALEILDHYGNYAIECFEKGTTAGILRFKGGLAAFVESRATKHHKNGKNSYKDGVQKFFIISKQSNLLYIGVGCASKCKLLAERLTIEVVVSQVSQQHIARCAGKTIEGTVGIEKALQMAQKILNKQAHSDPPNKDVFGGILTGHGPNKEYIAYYIGLSKTRRLDIQCISDYCFCPCGSGREFAVQILYELNVNPQGIAETAIDNIKSTIIYTFVNTPKSGAETYELAAERGDFPMDIAYPEPEYGPDDPLPKGHVWTSYHPFSDQKDFIVKKSCYVCGVALDHWPVECPKRNVQRSTGE